jgi:hypothetical protein
VSYRVLTGPAIPFVHALPSGLGAEPEAPSTWKEIIFRLSQPFAQAGSQRIAYGRTDPYYSPYGGGGSQMYYGAGAGAYGSPLSGISPTMLLLGGAALVAMMMLRK